MDHLHYRYGYRTFLCGETVVNKFLKESFMKVSSDSWHYKILMTEHQQMVRRGTSLCVYFWLVVLSMFIWTFAAVASVGITAAIGMACYLVFYVWYFLVADLFFGVQSFDLQNLNLSLGIHAFMFGVWVFSVIFRFKNKIVGREPSDNLVIEYVRAKKRKVCPIIEFEG